MNLPDMLPSCTITRIEQCDHNLIVHASPSSSSITCPRCGTSQCRIHGHYTRHPRDLPWSACGVRLALRVTRYRCLNPTCLVKTFSQDASPLAARYAQRTTRLRSMHAQIGVQLSANASVDLLQVFHMPCSRNTVLRSVCQLPMPPCLTPRVLGVDDWAFRKGKRYGTILVDLEQHRVIDLLPDRSATVLSVWLESHPGIEIITRDRASEYSRAITQTVPHAIQVADRFHLVQNLGATTQAWLERRKKALFDTLAQLRSLNPPPILPEEGGSDEPKRNREFKPRRSVHLQANRADRLEQYTTTLKLNAEGIRPAVISRRICVPESTVRWWLSRGEFPKRLGRRTALSAQHEALIRQRVRDGCSNAAELQRELTGLGCSASKSVVGRFVAFVREGEPLNATRTATLHEGDLDGVRRSVCKIARLLATPAARLDDRERQWITDLCRTNPEIGSTYGLIQELRLLLVGGCESCAAQLNAWIARARTCGVSELQRLGQSLQRDFQAVTAGLSL